MAQDNPYAKYLQPQAPADPIVKPADPYKAEDQQFQRNAEARAAQDQAFQREKFAWEKQKALQDTATKSDTLDPKTQSGQRNIAAGILKNTGVDLASGVDPVSDLIKKSTSGGLERIGAQAWGFVTGDATDGMEAINRLKTISSDMTLQMAGGSLGAQISNTDRDFLAERMGDIANPNKTADERLAAWDQVKQRLAQVSGMEPGPGMIDQQVKAADGRMITFKVKQGATEDEIRAAALAALKQADPANRYEASVSDATKQQVGTPSFWSGIGAGVGDLVEGGLNNTVGLVSNPVSSVIGRAMGYEGYTGDIGQTVRDALQLPEGNQTASAINQAAAGGLGGAGMARSVGGLVGSNALMQYGANPILDAVTGASAAASGETARQMGAGPGGQALATLAGGFVPAGLAGARNAVRGGRPPSGPAPDMNVVRAGERQGVPIRQPDARPEMRGDFANLQTSQYAGPAINQARQADNAIIEQRVTDIGGQGNAADPYALGQRVQAAGSRYIAQTRAQADRLYKRAKDLAAGTPAAPTTSTAPASQTSIPPSRGGWVIRDKETGTPVMETFDESVASKVNTAKYEVVPSRQHLEQFNAAVKQNGGQPPEGWNKAFGSAEAPQAAPQAASRPGPAAYSAPNADAVLEANIQELRAGGENSNGAAIKYLEGLRADLRGGLSIDSMLNLRSNMRGQISERGLTGTDTDRRVRQVIDAMNLDLTEQLPAEASAALKAADGFYRQRQEFINGTLKQFMGDRGNPLPAETAASRLVSMAQGKGNFERFSKMWGQLDDGERADVSATIAASLGRKANGDFSPATLIKSLDPRQGINPRTAKLIFGEEGAKALNDLRIIAQAKTDTANALNASKTGVMVNRSAGGLRTLILGGLGFSASGPIGAVAAPMAEGLISKIGQERAARLMLNPDFTKWLRAMPEATNPKAINAYFGKLKAAGAKSQVVANDIDGFTNAVLESFSQSPGRAAAQEENN